ncbi:hypothetical protein SteCoe_8856 [Stentor coeruleus]|uniref:Uncharacterized protein n=1 Tax=Stentor coeruleus TaxID=5963 RepID=A0A1R2CJA9_9CILI|nr:hypothetical protein SteCoe_8856 [Stentor coeruleus]
MSYENDIEGGSYEANYESDFEEVDYEDDNKPKNQNLPKPAANLIYKSNVYEEHDVTDESIEYVPNKKNPLKDVKTKEESEEIYDDSFQNYEFEESPKKEPEPKKPDPFTKLGSLQGKRSSERVQDPFGKNHEEKMPVKTLDKVIEPLVKNDPKPLFPIKGSQSPSLPPKPAKVPSARMPTPKIQKSVESTRRNSSPKNSLKLPKNSTLDKIKGKPELHRRTRQQIEKENTKLRSDLKELNEKLSQFLDDATQKKPMPKKSNPDQLITGGTVTDKRLKIYEAEYNKIKEKYDKYNDSEYLYTIKEEIKNKEKEVYLKEKIMKTMTKNQGHRGKKIEDLDDKIQLDEKTSLQQFQEEYINIEEQIKNLEKTLEKEQEWYENNYTKECELIEKLNKLKAIAENYQPEPIIDKKLANKYSSLNTQFMNIEKIRTNTQAQLKVQENSIRNQKDNLQKELTTVQKMLQDKNNEVNKIRAELENILVIASANNMSKLVSIVNLNKRPSSERSLSPYVESEIRKLENSRRSNRLPQNEPRNQSLSQKRSEKEFEKKIYPVQKSMEKPYQSKPFESLSSESKLKDLFKPEIQKPKTKTPIIPENIPENIPEEPQEQPKKREEKKSSLFKELEGEAPSVIKSPEPAKKNQKPSRTMEKPKNDIGKSSLFQELESSVKPEEKNQTPLKKPSIFHELEPETKPSSLLKPEIQSKPSIFSELDKNPKPESFKKPETFTKPSIFQELEQEQETKPGPTFKPITNFKKPSIFDELEDKTTNLDSGKKQSGWEKPETKPSIFDELESKPMNFDSGKKQAIWKEPETKPSIFQELDSKPNEDRVFKPISDKISRHESGNKEQNKGFSPFQDLDMGKKPSIFDEPEKKNDIFSKIDLPDPSTKRNRGHLIKKEDKISALAENAAKNDMFSNIFDNDEPEKLPFNVQSKLLPINRNLFGEKEEPKKLESKISTFEMKKPEGKIDTFEMRRPEPKNDVKKPKNFELEEEDLLL